MIPLVLSSEKPLTSPHMLSHWHSPSKKPNSRAQDRLAAQTRASYFEHLAQSKLLNSEKETFLQTFSRRNEGSWEGKMGYRRIIHDAESWGSSEQLHRPPHKQIINSPFRDPSKVQLCTLSFVFPFLYSDLSCNNTINCCVCVPEFKRCSHITNNLENRREAKTPKLLLPF